MVFKTTSGKTKPCLPPFYFSNNNQFILPSSTVLGGHVILMFVAVKKLRKKAVLSDKVSQLIWPASCFLASQLHQSHFLMNPKPWTLLDNQVSKPSPAVPPSSSLSLLSPGSPGLPHHLKDASLLSLPPSALPSCDKIWVGFCFWVFPILVAEMVASHNLLPAPISPGTEPSTGLVLMGHLMLEEMGARVNLSPLELEPLPHLPWTMHLRISTCLVGLLRSLADVHLPVVMGPSGSPFTGASASFPYIKSNHFPGLAPLAKPLCSVLVHQVYR